MTDTTTTRMASVQPQYGRLLRQRFPLPLRLFLASSACLAVLLLGLVWDIRRSAQDLAQRTSVYLQSSALTREMLLLDIELTELAIDVAQTSERQASVPYGQLILRVFEARQELSTLLGGFPAAHMPLKDLNSAIDAMTRIETQLMAEGKNVMADEAYHAQKLQYGKALASLARTEEGLVRAIAQERQQVLKRALWLLGLSLAAVPVIALIFVRQFHRYRSALGRTLVNLEEERQSVTAANEELAATYDRTLEGWVAALDLRDKETEGHTQRVTELTVALAQLMGISGAALENVRRGALLHDVGKLGIPDSILLKPGKLDDAERKHMELHVTYAYEWLRNIAYLWEALPIPHYHHEKWDGTGYPNGLIGESIPLPARIFAVVDVWDALSSDRPYRAAWPRARVLQHIEAAAGSHFDPAMVQHFLCYMDSCDPAPIMAGTH